MDECAKEADELVGLLSVAIRQVAALQEVEGFNENSRGRMAVLLEAMDELHILRERMKTYIRLRKG